MTQPSKAHDAQSAPDAPTVIRVVSHRPAAGEETGVELVQLAHCSDIIGLNAVAPAVVSGWVDGVSGWRVFSRGDDDRAGNAVLWRAAAFAELAAGQLAMAGSPAPASWVRVRHRGSGVVLTWVQCHLDRLAPREAMTALLELARAAGDEGEVVVAGDWGQCARSARERPDPSSPFAVFEQGDDPAELPGLRSTYSFFGFLTPATSGAVDRGEYRHHLSVLRRADPTQRALTFASHRVLSQFPSDHRPIQAVVHVQADGTRHRDIRRGRHH